MPQLKDSLQHEPYELELPSVHVTHRDFDHPKLQRFAKEVYESELFDRLMNYSGRYEYEGPAVKCRDMQDVMAVARVTTAELQRDHLGKGYVVYPKQHEDNPDVAEFVEFLKGGGTVEQFAQLKGLADRLD